MYGVDVVPWVIVQLQPFTATDFDPSNPPVEGVASRVMVALLAVDGIFMYCPFNVAGLATDIVYAAVGACGGGVGLFRGMLYGSTVSSASGLWLVVGSKSFALIMPMVPLPNPMVEKVIVKSVPAPLALFVDSKTSENVTELLVITGAGAASESTLLR